ncbi:MAG: glycosyltransferase family 1 protein [Hyphomicrobiaceae bacterium]|nr:MAG: glycosyltransferase family 1 protein [Hyphomicrobiaceae bacterium]
MRTHRAKSSKRVLIVGPTPSFKPSYGPWVSRRSGLMFYCFGYRLANGFVRNGHFVLTMNDRDSRKMMLGSSRLGAWHANRHLLLLANELQPDLLLLHHSDLIAPDTVLRVKEMLPDCRVAVVYYDDLFHPGSAQRFRRFLTGADFGFATTGGRTLAQFADGCPVAFIPNPVDLSIDNASAFCVPHKSADVFCAIGINSATNRWDLVDRLTLLKPNLRYALYGRDKKSRLLGDAYYRAIKQSKVGLNLNRRDGDLYASDRMAQYLGNGLLLATPRRSGFEAYFDDDEMIFFDDVTELGEKIEWAIGDDRRWRRMAERARSKATRTMGADLVAEFIMRMAFGEDAPQEWQFSSEIFGPEDMNVVSLPASPAAAFTAPDNLPAAVAAK